MVEIRIGTETGRLFVKSPFNKSFVDRARQLNGTWISSTSEWRFDPRDEQRVRDLCIELYGTDGRTRSSLVTLRVTLGSSDGSDLTLGGRSLVSRRSRDSGVRLGDGVIVLEGGFPKSGGSVKNPRVEPNEGTVLEVRDFPEQLARELIANGPLVGKTVEIVGSPYTNTPVVAAVDLLTESIEAGIAKINSEGGVIVDRRAETIATIRGLMAEHGIELSDLLS